MNRWQVWAAASAGFAALTAVLAKLGVTNIDSNLATFIRIVVILPMAALVVTLGGQWQPLSALPASGVKFLILSGLATGFSWLCYYKALQLGPVSRVAPFEKISVALAVVLGIVALGEPFTWKIATGTALIVSGALLLAW